MRWDLLPLYVPGGNHYGKPPPSHHTPTPHTHTTHRHHTPRLPRGLQALVYMCSPPVYLSSSRLHCPSGNPSLIPTDVIRSHPLGHCPPDSCIFPALALAPSQRSRLAKRAPASTSGFPSSRRSGTSSSGRTRDSSSSVVVLVLLSRSAITIYLHPRRLARSPNISDARFLLIKPKRFNRSIEEQYFDRRVGVVVEVRMLGDVLVVAGWSRLARAQTT